MCLEQENLGSHNDHVKAPDYGCQRWSAEQKAKVDSGNLSRTLKILAHAGM